MVVAARTSTGTVDYLTGDQQGTSSLAIDSGTLAVTRRYYDPYGNPVGTPPAGWPGTRGFVGGTADPATGLTNLGAREYDSATGSFISPDPLINPGDPQDLNAYAYASDNPASSSDPSGQMPEIMGGGCLGSIQYCEAHTASSGNAGNDRANSGSSSGTSGYDPTWTPYIGPAPIPVELFTAAPTPVRAHIVHQVSTGITTRPAASKPSCSIIHWCLHAPDYLTLDISAFTPWVVGGGLTMTLSRDGHLFIGPQVGAGTEGISGIVRAGWIGGPWGQDVKSNTQVDNFIHGNSFTAAGDLGRTPYMAGAAETWGNPFGFNHDDWATELGGGLGTPGFGVTYSYSFLPDGSRHFPGW